MITTFFILNELVPCVNLYSDLAHIFYQWTFSNFTAVSIIFQKGDHIYVQMMIQIYFPRNLTTIRYPRHVTIHHVRKTSYIQLKILRYKFLFDSLRFPVFLLPQSSIQPYIRFIISTELNQRRQLTMALLSMLTHSKAVSAADFVTQ